MLSQHTPIAAKQIRIAFRNTKVKSVVKDARAEKIVIANMKFFQILVRLVTAVGNWFGAHCQWDDLTKLWLISHCIVVGPTEKQTSLQIALEQFQEAAYWQAKLHAQLLLDGSHVNTGPKVDGVEKRKVISTMKQFVRLVSYGVYGMSIDVMII